MSMMDYDRRRGMGIGARLIPLLLGLVAIGFVMIKGCQDGPFGRKQVVALSPRQESEMGLQAFQEVLSTANTVPRGPLVDAVQQVAQRLINATQSEAFLTSTQTKPIEFEWQVEVINSHERNAFCLPGGKIVVYTGILPIAETDAGLAVVMGHEISHALAHHGAERMAQQQMAQYGMMAASGSMSDMDPQQRNQLLRLMNAGAKFGILSYGRGHETEADHMGLVLMAAAGYDPVESIKFWERMESSSSGGSPPEFLSTHPSHQTRVADLTRWLPEVEPIYDAVTDRPPSQPLPAR